MSMRLTVLLTLATTIALAADDLPRKTPGARTEVGTGVKDATVDYFDSVSDYFRNSRQAVLRIRDKGIPDEEVPAVLWIARNSKASPNQVIEARKGGNTT
jgi:hypothetical protein